MKTKIDLYDILALSAKYIIKKYKEISAKIFGNKFYCISLQGKSTLGITINSDLTVSCNCSDIYGHGKIGSLKSQTMAEILSGHKASSFRKRLGDGKLAIINCSFCFNLRMAKEKIDINTYQLPKEVLLENTINCNLNCLGCKKNKVYKQRSEKSISLQNIERLAIVLKNIGVKKIHFFHQGEPFCSNNIKKEIEILKKYNPSAFIITSTNGSLIDTPEKREAALMFDHIYFSIHGADQKSASKYMKNINFEKAYNNMKEIIRLREEEKTPVLEWKYVLFRWNDKPDLINKAISLAKIAGVDIISFYKTWYPLYAISYRYYLGFNYFQKIGEPSCHGREIDFRKDKN